jgi:hypothetical protein
MCLLTYQKEPIILKEDKVVWKLLKENLISQYADFEYILGKLYKTEIVFTNSDRIYDDEQEIYWVVPGVRKPGVVSISEGFHSFYSEKYIDIILDRSYLQYYKYKCTIPAGSEYYEDETGLCVSNQIIIVEKVD